jgi:hypothetical protein
LELQLTTSPKRAALAYSPPGFHLICWPKEKTQFSFAIDQHGADRKEVDHMTDKTYDLRIKRLEARMKRQDEYLNRVLQLLVKLLTRLTALESASV